MTESNRRQFLTWTALGTAGACALGGCNADTNPTLTSDVAVSLSEYPELANVGGQVRLGTSTTGYNFSIFVRNEGAGTYRALSGYCDHEACDVRASGTGFVCPCHGASFAADGALRSGPARSGLILFDTVVDRDTLTILSNA